MASLFRGSARQAERLRKALTVPDLALFLSLYLSLFFPFPLSLSLSLSLVHYLFFFVERQPRAEIAGIYGWQSQAQDYVTGNSLFHRAIVTGCLLIVQHA